MPHFEVWDIVKVPFPYKDRPVRQRRPAVVVVAANKLQTHGLLWVLMITSLENLGWPGDVEVGEDGSTGLPVLSLIRSDKIATIEAKDAEILGTLSAPPRRLVVALLSERLQLLK